MGKNLPSQDVIMPWKETLAFISIYKGVLYCLSGSEYIDISIVHLFEPKKIQHSTADNHRGKHTFVVKLTTLFLLYTYSEHKCDI